MPARKPREAAEAVPLEGVALPPALRSKSQVRRLQAATADPKASLPARKRAVEPADGELAAPIAGRYFRLSTAIGLMPLMEWAAATDDLDMSNGAQVLALYRLLRDIVDPADWAAFRSFTTEKKCDAKAFVDFQNAALEAIAARPTPEPAAS
jgi:hypothetical protein